jgi:hypothetical protein
MTPDEMFRRAQLLEESKPLWIANQFVIRPCTVLSIGFVSLLVIAFITNELGYFEMNEQGNRDFLIWDNDIVIDWDMRNLGRDFIEKYDGGDKKPLRT